MNLHRSAGLELTFIKQADIGKITPVTYQLPKHYDDLMESNWFASSCASIRIDGDDYMISEQHVRFLDKHNVLLEPTSHTPIKDMRGMILSYVPIFGMKREHPWHTNSQIQDILSMYRGVALSFDDGLLHFTYETQNKTVEEIVGIS